MPVASSREAVEAVIRTRTTVRAFRPDPVPRATVEELLELARLAPSTFNTQPWRVHVLGGAAKAAFSAALLDAHAGNAVPMFSPFPPSPPAPCTARQEDFGRRYYGALGIDRRDMQARSRQTGRNFEFFGAPIGLVVTIDGALTRHSWLDLGLFLQTLMLAAQARGFATCPQVVFARYQSVIAEQLGLQPGETVACGMSLGFADEKAPVNALDMPREPLSGFTRWIGFD